jgi:hypothetical protein
VAIDRAIAEIAAGPGLVLPSIPPPFAPLAPLHAALVRQSPQQEAAAAMQTFAAVHAAPEAAPPPFVPATVESLTVTGILRKAELMFEQPPATVLECATAFCASNPGAGAKDFLQWFKGEFDSGRLTGAGKWSASDSFQEKST